MTEGMQVGALREGIKELTSKGRAAVLDVDTTHQQVASTFKKDRAWRSLCCFGTHKSSAGACVAVVDRDGAAGATCTRAEGRILSMVLCTRCPMPGTDVGHPVSRGRGRRLWRES
eukprot:1765105-Rhodomonas_salina.1